MFGQPSNASPDLPCWLCHWYDGMDTSGTMALCNNAGCSRCRSQPERGCSSFLREVGGDDESGRVPARPVMVPLRAVRR